MYWRHSFRSLLTSRDLVPFIVLDVDLIGSPQGKWALAEATVARESDFGVNDKTYFTRTHLGRVLKPGEAMQKATRCCYAGCTEPMVAKRAPLY